MRILYVTTISLTMNTFFKPHVEMLIQEGNQVDIACNYEELPLDTFYEENGCNFHQIDFSRSPMSINNLRAYGQLKKVLECENYDIVHCHTPNASVITRIACRRFRKKSGLKVFYTAHGFHFYKGAPILNWMIFYPIEKICSFFTDKLITINKEDYELARKKFHAKEVHYVPGVGIDLSKFENIQVDKKEKRKEIGVSEDAFLLLSVGELNENKNHQVIIRALARINNPNIHYVVAGIGDYKNNLLELAKNLGVITNVHLIGYKKNVEELYNVSDLFCFPSKREGLGLAAIEAMASGLPIIAAINRGTKEYVIVDENGFLFDSKNVQEISKLILKLQEDNNLYKKLLKKVRKTVDKYDIKNVIEIMQEIYEK